MKMTKAVILSIIFMCVLTICRGQDDGKNTAKFYFPLEVVFRDTTGDFMFNRHSPSYVRRDTLINKWYSGQLRAMEEPVAYTDKSDNEIYRFTWLRTFHHPIAIRIEKQDKKYMLYWKVCSGQGGYAPGNLVTDEQKSLDENTWIEFKKLLSQIDFWNLETYQKTRKIVTHKDGTQWLELSIGADGAQWILEGKTNFQYHVVDRWTPDKEDTYHQCCDFLIKLTGLEISDKDKY